MLYLSNVYLGLGTLMQAKLILADTPPPQCVNPSATDYSGCGFADPDACLELNRCFLFSAVSGGPPLSHEYTMNSGTSNDWVQQCQCACGNQAALQHKADTSGVAASISCIGSGNVTASTSTINVDVGHCICNLPLIDELATDIVKALPAATEIGCLILFGALAIAELGVQAIPGVGEAVDAGMGFAWGAAKLASPCGTSALSPNLQKIFGILSGITSIGSKPFKPPKGIKPYTPPPAKPAGNGHPAGQAHPPAKPHTPAAPHTITKPTPKETTPTDHETTKPPKTTPPTTQSHKTEESSTKSTGSSSENNLCPRDAGWSRLYRRAPKNCDITSITKSNPFTKTITRTCDGKLNPQACANLYSAARNGKGKESIRDWYACTDSQVNGRDLQSPFKKFVDDWGDDHDSSWREYITSSYYWSGKLKSVTCERDEWPPAYFLPPKARSKGWSQVVRFIPGSENGSTGNLWNAFCKKHDGGVGNGQFKAKRGGGEPTLNTHLNSVKHQRSVIRNGKTTTYLEVDYTRAVMSLAYKWRTKAGAPDPPNSLNDWYLSENPCWPSAIVPDDPGFVLLTDDPWYATHRFPKAAIKASTELYKDVPNAKLIPAAQARLKKAPKLLPPSRKRSLEFLEDGFGLTDFNSSRRLTDDEIAENLEVINCEEETCSQVLEMLGDSDGESNGAFIVVAGRKPSRLPANNDVSRSTMTTHVAAATTPNYHHEQP